MICYVSKHRINDPLVDNDQAKPMIRRFMQFRPLRRQSNAIGTHARRQLAVLTDTRHSCSFLSNCKANCVDSAQQDGAASMQTAEGVLCEDVGWNRQEVTPEN